MTTSLSKEDREKLLDKVWLEAFKSYSKLSERSAKKLATMERSSMEEKSNQQLLAYVAKLEKEVP